MNDHDHYMTAQRAQAKERLQRERVDSIAMGYGLQLLGSGPDAFVLTSLPGNVSRDDIMEARRSGISTSHLTKPRSSSIC